jgi:hypothetical protein
MFWSLSNAHVCGQALMLHEVTPRTVESYLDLPRCASMVQSSAVAFDAGSEHHNDMGLVV